MEQIKEIAELWVKQGNDAFGFIHCWTLIYDEIKRIEDKESTDEKGGE